MFKRRVDEIPGTEYVEKRIGPRTKSQGSLRFRGWAGEEDLGRAAGKLIWAEDWVSPGGGEGTLNLAPFLSIKGENDMLN